MKNTILNYNKANTVYNKRKIGKNYKNIIKLTQYVSINNNNNNRAIVPEKERIYGVCSLASAVNEN